MSEALQFVGRLQGPVASNRHTVKFVGLRSTPFEARLSLLVKGGGSFSDVFGIIRDHDGERRILERVFEGHRLLLVHHSFRHSYRDRWTLGESFGPVSS